MGALPRKPLVIALTLLVPLLLPTVATAGTAELTTSTFGGRADETVLFVHLAYTARRGEVNRLRVLFDATGATIIDRAGVAPGRGCARIRDEESLKVRCDFGGATVAELRVSLGDRRDVAHERGRIPEYEGGIGGMLAMVGGPGDDRLDSGDANGTLSGGGGDDLLRSQHGAVFVGGPGNDRMLGGAGFDTFRAGADLDGRDTMLGGGGRDAVSYEARRAGVHADLKGDRDDGTPGELDRIGSDVEDLTGGDGPDRLVGNGRRNRLVAGGGRDLLAGLGGPDELDGQQPHGRAADDGDRMLGGSGDDSLNGGAGNDVLVGGAGWDIAQAGPGDDTFIARDSGPDQITCGGGRDRLNLDRWDWFEARYGACESVRRSAPPVAVAIFVRRRLSYHVDRPVALAEIGCPGDARVMCTGTAEIISEGGSRATVDIRLRPGELAFPEVPLDTATWEAAKAGARPRVQFVLRVREPHGNVVRLVYAVRIE